MLTDDHSAWSVAGSKWLEEKSELATKRIATTPRRFRNGRITYFTAGMDMKNSSVLIEADVALVGYSHQF